MRRDWEPEATPFRRRTQAVLWPLLKLVWGLRVSGLEHIPEEGPVIVAGNHNANIDGPILGVATGLALRYCLPLTKIEIYAVPVVGWFLTKVGTIPLDRRGDVQALRQAIEWVESGHGLVIFPEGTRSKTGVPGRAKAGTGFLASRTGAPVVPVRIEGTRAFPWRGGLRVTFGPAMRFENKDADRDACLAFSQSVLDKIISLHA
jgi:1-acyl-sn-glycerol-3-phosphate acyltransferase